MSSTPKTALITGGAGFIGAWTGLALADAGYRVVLADVRELSAEGRYLLGDRCAEIPVVRCPVEVWPAVTDAFREWRPDVVMHVAAITNPVALQSDPYAALRVNVEGTFNVLEAARQAEVGKVVVFSSIGVLPTVQYEPIDAAHPTVLAREGPGSGFYGASKLAGEAFALSYVSSFGLDVRIVRPSAVYGLGMNWPIYIKPMVECAVRGEAVEFESGGRFPRDYTHVADVASLALALCDAPPEADRIFYAATGNNLTTAGELARIVQQVVPGARIEIADAISAEDMLELRYRGRLSVANADAQLGWAPRYGSLVDGVTEYTERYRSFLADGG
jgi:nucleoside-diphosphate-sugar epimerase